MSRHKAEYHSALHSFRADMEKRDARHAQREVQNTRWAIGLFIAAVISAFELL